MSTGTLPVKAAITLGHLIFPLALALTWHGRQDGFHLFSRRLRANFPQASMATSATLSGLSNVCGT